MLYEVITKIDPNDMMDEVNHFFLYDLSQSELFITMFYVNYNYRDRLLKYSSAGHNRPLLWDNNYRVVVTLDAEGLIFGVSYNFV